MDKIVSIETSGETTTVLIDTNKPSVVNLLRRAILSEIETYAIDVVIFDVNTSPRYDEIIALRLGQLVIDHTLFQPTGEEFRTNINFSGPGEFTSDDIPGIPFTYRTPIATLLAGQTIKCEVIVKKGIGRTHVKWRPVSTVSIKEQAAGYRLTFKSIGMMPGEQIIREAIPKIEEAANRKPINLFFGIISE